MKLFKKIVKRFLPGKKNKPIKQYHKISFSQCGEDLLVDYIFNLRGINKPSYIDIGANAPFFLNNTNIFYQRGCRGINIDANPNCIERFKKERPEDVNLAVGIGSENSNKIFYVMNDSTLSTFSEVEYQKYLKTGKYKLVEKKLIKITTLQEVLSIYNKGLFPDFLSIDVEGLDFEIIKSINFAESSPKIICIEAAEYSPIGSGERRNEIINFLEQNDYYEYANTNLNAIMVKRDFWFI
ncbi:FkbM family methyltransferase [Yeosuana sp. MJ-SS3]|uniref:FkbM family methyltransferase n=1 Tax=Gilvirhabdus luticola TaxID=3079858 RepID=A0ABU3U4Y2_9FLAO|nr:FkbM family methyltransferase [Yeosuana sp. MJ-SS3]MDU8885472.1 FkbM family methyltransferase [Yeosuana sp. MJ-SS3]